MVVHEVKSEVSKEIYIVDVEGVSLGEPTNNDLALVTANTSSPIHLRSRYAHATQTALASLGAPLVFEPLRVFELYLQEENGGFRRDQM
jgi:hypothetical protein